MPSEDLIKQEQAKLAIYGNTQDTVRSDFAYSQAAYDQYATMARNMLGYDADSGTIRGFQDQTAGKSARLI